MVEAATNFRKSGFNNADSAMLAQVAAQYQNIADTAVSAGDAAASITSQIRAFGEDASFATTVISAYNEVANRFSVGTNDISNAMEIASSGMATYGNSFQSVIGLVTAGTEIMQGRASQVARGLSTIAARIVKNQDALAEYGIQVEKTDGSLKSTFDVLSELKPKWDAMTDAQRVALGDTLAGQNQYKVLASVMQNFQHAIDATNTALESAGSAAKENARYMESLEASENALKAEFEDFANRVLSKDVVKGFLEAGTSMLDFANNDVGAAISRISLLTTGMIGLTGIAGQTIGKIAEVGLQLKNLGVGGDSFLGMLASGKIALIVGGAVAAIALLAEAIRAIQNAYDEAHPSFEDANKNLQETQTEIQNTTAELEQYKQKIQELDAIDPKDRGAGWASERAELETNVQTAEAYLDVLKQIEQAQTGKIEGSKYVTGYTGQNVGNYSNGYIGTEASGQLAVTESQVKAITAEYTTQEEAVMSISLALKDYITGWETFQDMSMDDVVAELSDQLEALGINVHSTVETISQSFDNMGTLADKAADGFDELTKAEQDQATQYLYDYQAYVRGLIDSGNQLDAEQRREIQNYLNLSATSANFNRTQATTADTISFVASAFGITADSAANFAASIGYIDPTLTGVANNMVQLADGAWALKENCEQGADGLYYLKDGCDALAGSGDGAADALSQIEVATYDTSTAAAQLTASLFDQNGQLTEAAQTALSVDGSMVSLAQSELQAQQAAAQANYANLILEIQKVGSAAMITAGQLSQMMAMAGVGGSTSDMKRTYQIKYGKSAEADTEAYNKWLSSTLADAADAKYRYRMQELQNQLKQVSGYVPSSGGGSSRKSAEEKAAEEAEKQAKKAQKAQEKAAKESQQAYESAAKSAEQAAQEAARAAEQAAEEAKQKILDSIQELKDTSDDFWDSKTDAIEETNKELDRQKQLEEKLKALEEAKQKKILLYKNGQFQYDKDYGTIAKAQADYEETRDKIQRERELEQLEEMKDNATEIFNEMKDIVQNGGDVTQSMINGWLSQMQSDGANYYDSNKKMLNEWLDWARGAITEFTMSVSETVSGSGDSSGSGSSNGGGDGWGLNVWATQHQGDRHNEDERGSPYVDVWYHLFKKELLNGLDLGVNSVFVDYSKKILDGIDDVYEEQDYLQRNQAIKILYDEMKTLTDQLGYVPDYLKEFMELGAGLKSNIDIIAMQYAQNYDKLGSVGKTMLDAILSGNEDYMVANKSRIADIAGGTTEDLMWWSYVRTAGSAAAAKQLFDKRTEDDKKVAEGIYGDKLSQLQTMIDRAGGIVTDEIYEWATKAIGVLDPFGSGLTSMYSDVVTGNKYLYQSQAALEQLGYHGFLGNFGYTSEGGVSAPTAALIKSKILGSTVSNTREESRNRLIAGNISRIEDNLEDVAHGQRVSQEYINKAKDFIAKTIQENSNKWFDTFDEAEKERLHVQNEQLRVLQSQVEAMESQNTTWDKMLDNEQDIIQDFDIDIQEQVEALRAQMDENSAAWWQTEGKEERDALHEANVELARQIEQLLGNGAQMKYEGHTGTWSWQGARNASGTHNFMSKGESGISLVGENGPELRVLRRGDNIIPANQTANLWKWSNTTPQQMLTTLSARSGGSNTSYAFNVSRIELPNVTDAKSFVQGLKNYALQYSYKR